MTEGSGIPDWLRRDNGRQARAFAKRIAARVGHERRADFNGHELVRTVPARVHGYTLRLRLWAYDLERYLR